MVADHAVMGSVLMPGTGFVELALAAGQYVGAEVVEELTLQAPLPLGEGALVSLQVSVWGGLEGDGELAIYLAAGWSGRGRCTSRARAAAGVGRGTRRDTGETSAGTATRRAPGWHTRWLAG